MAQVSQPTSPTLRRVLGGQLCSGCGLCAGIANGAVEMTTVEPGYSRPRQTAPIPPPTEAAIAAACPGSRIAAWTASPFAGAPIDPYWGPHVRVGVGHASDAALRHEASSGGMLSALLTFALQQGDVDRVIHVAADPASPTRNVMTASRTAAEILAGAGSRYAPSSPLADIATVLAEGGRAALVGKPCDISALRLYARHDARVEKVIPLALSFFCAAISSHSAAGRVIADMGLEADAVVAFRYRGRGWPGKAAAVTASGQTGELSYMASWGDRLSKEVQFRCKICPDAVGGVADIACADAWWGDDEGYPTFEDRPGRSLAISRTAAGEDLLARAIAAGAVSFAPLDIGDIIRMQPSQARRKRLVASRLAALSATLQPKPAVAGLMVGAAARRAGAWEQGRSFLGATRRIILDQR